jgi:hypothetical protein
MLRFPISSLPLAKQKMLTMCGSVPRFYITVERYDFHERLGAIVYDLQVGIQDREDVIAHTIQARFSQLELLDKKLRDSVPSCESLKPFPPKRWLCNTNDRFLRARSMELQRYLLNLVQIRTMGTNPDFTGFLQIAGQFSVV